MNWTFTIKKAQVEQPTTPKPTYEPADGYQWSWDVNSKQWIQVPLTDKNTFNITDNNIYASQQELDSLNQLLDGEKYSNDIKIESSLFEKELVEPAGYDFKNGAKIKISAKGLELLKKVEEDKIKQLEADINSINSIPTTEEGLMYPVGNGGKFDPTYDEDCKRFTE